MKIHKHVVLSVLIGLLLGAFTNPVLATTYTNQAPVFSAASSVIGFVDHTLAFPVSATDPEGTAVTISASGVPAGASYGGGSFSWTPIATDVGTHVVQFVATDSGLVVQTEQGPLEIPPATNTWTITITINSKVVETPSTPEPEDLGIPGVSDEDLEGLLNGTYKKDETCTDGILNQDEEDIDCGGVCDTCGVEDTCTDGIKNQDEEETDCGGVCDDCEVPTLEPPIVTETPEPKVTKSVTETPVTVTEESDDCDWVIVISGYIKKKRKNCDELRKQLEAAEAELDPAIQAMQAAEKVETAAQDELDKAQSSRERFINDVIGKLDGVSLDTDSGYKNYKGESPSGLVDVPVTFENNTAVEGYLEALEKWRDELSQAKKRVEDAQQSFDDAHKAANNARTARDDAWDKTEDLRKQLADCEEGLEIMKKLLTFLEDFNQKIDELFGESDKEDCEVDFGLPDLEDIDILPDLPFNLEDVKNFVNDLTSKILVPAQQGTLVVENKDDCPWYLTLLNDRNQKKVDCEKLRKQLKAAEDELATAKKAKDPLDKAAQDAQDDYDKVKRNRERFIKEIFQGVEGVSFDPGSGLGNWRGGAPHSLIGMPVWFKDNGGVKDFLDKIKAWEKELKEAKTAEDDAKQALDQAKDAAKQAQDNYDKDQKKVDDLKKKLEACESELKELEESLKLIEGLLNALSNDLEMGNDVIDNYLQECATFVDDSEVPAETPWYLKPFKAVGDFFKGSFYKFEQLFEKDSTDTISTGIVSLELDGSEPIQVDNSK